MRDFLAKKFIESKNNMQLNFTSEKLGDIALQKELRKAYKPTSDSQSAMSTVFEGSWAR